MKINFVITKLLRFGGVEVQLLRTVRGLVERGHTVRLIVLQHLRSPIYDDLPEGVSLCFAFQNGLSSPGQKLAYHLETKFFRGKLKRLITENGPDLVISFKEGPGSVLLLPGLGVPTLVYVHNIIREAPPRSIRSRFVERLYRRALQSIDSFVFVSESSRQSFIKRYGVSAARHAVVYNCVSVSELQEHAAAFPVPEKAPDLVRLCFSGRLEPEKGILCLLQALAELKHEGCRFEMLICGDGSLEAACRQIIAENNMESQVQMLGYCENPFPYIASSDWLVSASEFESFGLSVLEAIALGTKVLSTRSLGTEEIISAVGGGVLIEHNSQAIRDGLRDVLAGKIVCPPAHDVAQIFGEEVFFSRLCDFLEKVAHGA
jgi:glycosyltransferase involved in cell wall biosynthesis